MAKTWREKYESPAEPELTTVPASLEAKWGRGKLLIATPKLIDAEVRKVPKGRVARLGEIRQELARQHGAAVTCPLTTGIFLRVAAELANEEEAEGKKRIAPYWRVVRDDGELIDKLPGGCANQARRLQEEGHRVVQKGKKWRLAPTT
ncbi:MAG: MGMT family protein [Bryobacteraceae bacterium]|nr:MGMT family protein [Bryobacteraceae bacterium]